MPHDFHFHSIIAFLKSNSYLGIFAVSLFGAYLIPVPEAVLLMLAGYVAGAGIIKIGWVLVIVIAGGIIGDGLLFGLSYSGSKYVERFRRKVRKSKLDQYEHYVEKHIGKAIFFLRLIVGVRFFSPIIAGSLRINWKKFFLYEFLAVIFNAFLFVFLGYFFRRHIFLALTTVEIIKNILFISSAVIVSILVGFFSKKIIRN